MTKRFTDCSLVLRGTFCCCFSQRLESGPLPPQQPTFGMGPRRTDRCRATGTIGFRRLPASVSRDLRLGDRGSDRWSSRSQSVIHAKPGDTRDALRRS